MRQVNHWAPDRVPILRCGQLIGSIPTPAFPPNAGYSWAFFELPVNIPGEVVASFTVGDLFPYRQTRTMPIRWELFNQWVKRAVLDAAGVSIEDLKYIQGFEPE